MSARPRRVSRPTPPVPARTRERAAVVDPLRARMYAAVDAMTDRAPLSVLQKASAAQTGAGSLAVLVGELPEADPVLATADPEAAAVARMAEVKRRLMADVPTWTAAEVAAHLRVTQAAVRKARHQGRVLAVDYAGQARYPAFQFTADGIRPEMRSVLAAFDAVPIRSDWVRLDFLTAPDAAEEGGRSAAELLRDGDVGQVLDVISGYGEQGA